MLLWIIKDGEKTGPFEDYQLREMIREGKLEEETGVWHEGAEGWLLAKDVQILKGEFEQKVVVPPPIPIVVPPFLAWRRLGARVFDYFLFQLILMSTLKMIGFDLIPDSAAQASSGLLIGTLVAAILMEAALVSSFGFTPGKWLMSLRVENHLGKRLSTSYALIRTMRVWVLGMGMMHPLLMLVGHGVTLWFGLKRGAPLWDLHSGFRVPGTEVKSGNVVLYWILLAALVGGLTAVMWPELGPLVEEEMRRQGK